ncbi:MAG TPA: S8 family serine peptidase, partial [Patescibacteria group bacterium]|nr:S8 family serine peptidase [Patescibacteria group bacterium]
MFKRTTALSVVLLSTLLAMGGAAALAADAPAGGAALVEQVGAPPAGGPTVSLLVKFKASATAGDIDAAVRGSGGSTARSFNQLRTRVITVPAGAADRILAAFAHLSTVEHAAAAVTMSKAGDPSDPSYAQQWALPKIQWDLAYANVPITGSATIAVLDTGIDASHPDLAGRVIAGASETGGDPNIDPNGHGTALAGIAAANVNDGVGIAGVGYAGVNVMPVQVLGADGTGTDADVVAGVLWATDNGAQVILMGFSSADYSFALADAVQYAWDHGVVLIAATGNDGSSGYSYPAGMPNVIGVASTDEN